MVVEWPMAMSHSTIVGWPCLAMVATRGITPSTTAISSNCEHSGTMHTKQWPVSDARSGADVRRCEGHAVAAVGREPGRAGVYDGRHRQERDAAGRLRCPGGAPGAVRAVRHVPPPGRAPQRQGRVLAGPQKRDAPIVPQAAARGRAGESGAVHRRYPPRPLSAPPSSLRWMAMALPCAVRERGRHHSTRITMSA